MGRRAFNRQATKDQIKQSFLQLYTQQGLDRLTVSALCEVSGVAKSTFYLYYQDKYSVLQELEQEAIAELTSINMHFDSYKISDLREGKITPIARATVDYVFDHTALLHVLLSPHSAGRFLHVLRHSMEEGFLTLYRVCRLPQKNERLAAVFFSASTLGLFNYIVYEDVTLSRSEMYVVFGNLLLSTLSLQQHLS